MSEASENGGHIGVFVDRWGRNRVLMVGASAPFRLVVEENGGWKTLHGSILTVHDAGDERHFFCSGQRQRVYELGKPVDTDGGYEILETPWFLDDPPTGI